MITGSATPGKRAAWVETGSNDVKATDAFVAEHMLVAVSDLTGGPTPGSVVNPNALYALPVFSLFPSRLSGWAWATRSCRR